MMTGSGARLGGGVWGLLAVALAVVLAVAVLPTSSADARSTLESSYGFDRTYNCALRLIRIDLGLKITEKDDKTGYIVFDYKSTDTGNKTSSGSIEFIRSATSEGPVGVVLQLPQMPQYEEQVLVNALWRKLRQEYGDPPQRPKTPPPPPQPPPPSDAGAADSADGETP
jgi:hypothetical protein